MTEKFTLSAREKLEFRHNLEGLNESTINAYKGLANHFYGSKLGGRSPTPKLIADALQGASDEYRPGYWRKLRNALMYDQIEKGYFEAALRIKKTKNPLTIKPRGTGTIKSKQKRCKSINDKDLEKLYSAALSKPDFELASALAISMYTGCRPAEMAGIRRVGIDQVFIQGAKKSKGTRGLDRTITLSEKECETVEAAAATLYHAESGISSTMHKVQSRLDRLTKKLWPKRKIKPTLYTLRHQLGSDLKAGFIDEDGKRHTMSRVEIAYVMGHQSTESIEIYGNRRSGKGTSKSRVKPAPGADMSMIREKHNPMPGPKAPSVKSTYKVPSLGR
jgi:integrase